MRTFSYMVDLVDILLTNWAEVFIFFVGVKTYDLAFGKLVYHMLCNIIFKKSGIYNVRRSLRRGEDYR